MGPSNNQARNLDWVPVEENLKARKYLGPDGKPKPRKGKKVINNVPKANAKKVKAVPQKEKAPKPLPKEDQIPDKDEFIPDTETLGEKIKYLAKNSKEFRTEWVKTRKVVPHLRSSNLAKLHKEATGKGVKLEDKRSPHSWKTKLISALYAIRSRLKT
jgi:hypothetical protein